MYYRLPGDVSAGVYDRVASLWFVGMVVIFMSGNSALTISYTQKPLLRREVYAGHYSYLPYYIAKTLTTLPLQLAYATLYVLMTYFLVRTLTTPTPYLPLGCPLGPLHPGLLHYRSSVTALLPQLKESRAASPCPCLGTALQVQALHV